MSHSVSPPRLVEDGDPRVSAPPVSDVLWCVRPSGCPLPLRARVLRALRDRLLRIGAPRLLVAVVDARYLQALPGAVVTARTAWKAYEAAALCDKRGVRLHYSEVDCKQIGAGK